MTRNDAPEISSSTNSKLDVDALVIGAGFAGMYQLHKLRKLGLRARVLERAAGVGGTWYWNRYPGARCDIPSLFYTVSYTPEINQEWSWTERFGTHAAIRAYMEAIAREEDMLPGHHVRHRARPARPGMTTRPRWTSMTDSGEQITSRYLILATGALSESRVPQIPAWTTSRGAGSTPGAGRTSRSDFTGRRVALIGTGSTGVQVLPVVAAEAADVTVLPADARSSCCLRRNVPVSDEEAAPGQGRRTRPLRSARAARRLRHTVPGARRSTCDEMSGRGTRSAAGGAVGTKRAIGGYLTTFADHLGLKNEEVNDIVAEFCRKKIREIVDDPDDAETLMPYGYPIGINRIIIGTELLRDLQPGQRAAAQRGRRSDRRRSRRPASRRPRTRFEVDDIIFATGYDGLTGSFTSIDVRSRRGRSIKEHWADGPKTYLGMQLSRLPQPVPHHRARADRPSCPT